MRRWGACRIASFDSGRSPEIIARVTELDARAGDAIMTGLLDATATNPPDTRGALVELGCQWSNGSVRLRALKLVAEADPGTAIGRERRDPSETVRARGERLASGTAVLPGTDRPGESPVPAALAESLRQPATQASLFD